MSMTDPVADLFVRIQNATKRGHKWVSIPASRLKNEVLRVLQAEGFIKSYEAVTIDGHLALRVELRYLDTKDQTSLIQGLRRISKPGRRVYVGKRGLQRVKGGLGIAILTTSRGVMTDHAARQEGLGGEVLGHVW